ncbi:NXPE family member 4-like [Protopterus annectens]|uniref:NXPE family member 4-like n=1 Tax=Protopterus annectens TaxID=7888 RepID=UPI001CFB754E|nr:NXPE family member 4-like [Protopterus annectens]
MNTIKTIYLILCIFAISFLSRFWMSEWKWYAQFLRLKLKSKEEPDVGFDNKRDADPNKILQEADDIYQLISSTKPLFDIPPFERSTSAHNSKYYIMNPTEVHSTGNLLYTYVETYDYQGNRKTTGGDFFRARIYDKKTLTAAVGSITDFNNGSYLVTFPLYWEGTVYISIKLQYSSEMVSLIHRLRDIDNYRMGFRGIFLSKNYKEMTKCHFNLTFTGPLCDLYYHNSGIKWMCEKPKNLSCENLSSLEYYFNEPSLSEAEKKFDDRKNVLKEIRPVGASSVIVKKQGSNINLPKCQSHPLTYTNSTGFVQNHTWISSLCQVKRFRTSERVIQCIKGKKIYLVGDSTIRQWFEYLVKIIPTLSKVNVGRNQWYSEKLAVDLTNNIYLQWRTHGLPWHPGVPLMLPDSPSAVSLINNIYGGKEFITVICLGAHFTRYPLKVYLETLIHVRNAVKRLLGRSPDTTVILKNGNTRTPYKLLLDNDWLTYELNQAFVAAFMGMNVSLVDAWDLTAAYESAELHPSEEVIKNEVDVLFSYICPNID